MKVKLRVDNMPAITLIKNPLHHERNKHMDVKFHFLRDCIEDGKVDIGHVSTDGNLLTFSPRRWAGSSSLR